MIQLGTVIQIEINTRLYEGKVTELVEIKGKLYRFVIDTGMPYPNHLISIFADSEYAIVPQGDFRSTEYGKYTY